jgi:hypothetical protein
LPQSFFSHKPEGESEKLTDGVIQCYGWSERFTMQENYKMIVSAEEQFAREVTLGVIVQQPLSVWHVLIPGVFIFDFLRRNTAISRYTRHFMFPRRLAIDAAQNLLKGYDTASVNSKTAAEIENWLNALGLYSPQLDRAQKKALDLLTAHYGKLLAAEGTSYYELIEHAYASREAFENHLRELAAAEDDIDREIMATAGDNQKLKEKLQLEKQQVAMRRQKILEAIF